MPYSPTYHARAIYNISGAVTTRQTVGPELPISEDPVNMKNSSVVSRDVSITHTFYSDENKNEDTVLGIFFILMSIW